ncbi:MAG TPA: DUF302 domain-containing protein [Patescibacteria group bacterium]|nr:DUF302 domain-containing protein [Patescibacteria group bacterium]
MFETPWTFATRVAGTPSAARPRVEAALSEEGFGVLTEIDVAATMKAKLGIERPPYLILGACKPKLAHRALEIDPSVGALLPCNVVLRADGDGTIVEALDPAVAMGTGVDGGLAEVAAEARGSLRRVIAALEAGG